MALWHSERAVSPQFEPIDLLSLDYATSGPRPEAAFDWIKKPLNNPKSKVIELAAFPELQDKTHDIDMHHVANYLNQLILSYNNEQAGCVLLPSLLNLSEFFGVTYPVIQQAFRQLKQYGHDYMVPGMYGDISVWTAPLSVESYNPVSI